MTLAALPWFLASYLVGAFPTSYLAGKIFKGIDLRQHGSKNLGATNVYRVLGWKFAVPVAIVDILKGTLPVVAFAPHVSSSTRVAMLVGAMAVLGHVFSIFVGGKGGKGVATATGVMLGLAPAAVGICMLVWLVLVKTTGYVSLGSMLGAAALPIGLLVLHPDRRELVLPSVALAALIIFLHRANIRRLLNGTENRFGRRAAPGATA
ncbi:MAG TPA: glycerol-3-phosphate 1-O-acyltransferase PlsY [Gemmatimonadales bacterium]|nr:glycerol-3-phosphate 1-O-acyltransferase PlsY [Gemmatimonadales bacterium]